MEPPFEEFNNTSSLHMRINPKTNFMPVKVLKKLQPISTDIQSINQPYAFNPYLQLTNILRLIRLATITFYTK